MRHGSANVHADAENRGSHRNAVLQVWGSRLHQTERQHKDPRRDDCPLHGEVLAGNHRAEAGLAFASLTFRRRSEASPSCARRRGGFQGRRRLLISALAAALKLDSCSYAVARFSQPLVAARDMALKSPTTIRIGAKGQFTVPKQFRRELGLEAGAPRRLLSYAWGTVSSSCPSNSAWSSFARR